MKGRLLIVTRAREQSADWVERIEARGGIARVVPSIAFLPPDESEPLRRALDALDRYDGLVFTSVNGVERFFDQVSPERVARHRFAAVGAVTAEALKRRGFSAALLPIVRASGRWLQLRAQEGREEIAASLREAGGEVEVVAVYKTVLLSVDRAVVDAGGRPDAILFGSPSAVVPWVRDVPEVLARTLLAAIGPTTARALAEAGFRPHIVAPTPTGDSLVAALDAHFRP